MFRLKIITNLLFLVLFISIKAQDSKYEDHYKNTASELAKNLQARIGLSDAQTTEISDILVEYNKRVWGIKYNLVPAARDIKTDEGKEVKSDANSDVTKDKESDNTNPANQKTGKGDSKTQNNQTPEQKKDEFRGTTRDNDSVSYYAGLGRHEIENLMNADREANENIESVLEAGQRDKYLDVKIDWWAVVKDKVYNTKYNTNPMGTPEDQQK